MDYEVRYTRLKNKIVRTLIAGTKYSSSVEVTGNLAGRADDYDWHWLRLKKWPEVTQARGTLTVADLFCGSGGLSLGAWEAARAVQLCLKPILAVDNDPDSLSAYRDNFAPAQSFCAPIEMLVDGELGARVTPRERPLLRKLRNLDLLLAGPPCQGHSDLNNHTRREDPRNELLLRVVRFAELCSPRHILIENVQGVRHDRSGVFRKAELTLSKLGYFTDSFLLEGHQLGMPQKRRRCFLIASRTASLSLTRLQKAHARPAQSFDWACSDLQKVDAKSVFDSSAKVYPENQRRMEYLIDNDLYDLPDSERPDCHRLKEHDYRAVYGRLSATKPAPTITTGFGSPGQGRYTHPRVARTLTPHEAARLQFLPDFFHFNILKRKRLQKMIGNSVPPKMAFAAIVDMLCHE